VTLNLLVTASTCDPDTEEEDDPLDDVLDSILGEDD